MSKSPHRKPESSDDAASDLRQALLRLKQGKPRNSQLRSLLAKGQLRISISAVAKEAGRSRTLIGMDACKYPGIRSEILAAMTVASLDLGEKPFRETPQQRIVSLSRENTMLRHDCALLATRVMDAINVARSLEKKLERAERQTERVSARKGNRSSADNLENGSKNVLPFSRGNDHE